MDAYLEAQRLYAEAIMSTASPQDRITELERTIQRIGELLPQAPPAEAAAVLLLNSSLAQRLAELPRRADERPRRGPEILPGTWEYDWVTRGRRQGRGVAGRPSHWNGKLYEEPGPVAGSASPTAA